MFKLCVLSVLLTTAVVCGAPAPTPGAGAVLAAAVLPAPIVTASSSQVVARNYNTLAAAPLAAYYSTYAVAPAAAYAAYSAPVLL